jgi:hypothetical protein
MLSIWKAAANLLQLFLFCKSTTVISFYKTIFDLMTPKDLRIIDTKHY